MREYRFPDHSDGWIEFIGTGLGLCLDHGVHLFVQFLDLIRCLSRGARWRIGWPRRNLLFQRLDSRLLFQVHFLEGFPQLALLLLKLLLQFLQLLIELCAVICLLGLSDDRTQEKGRRPP